LQANSTNVVDFSRFRADRAFERFFGITYPQRVRQRATRIRQYVEAVEQHALACDHRALDWLDSFVLPALERAIEEHERLAARAMAWARERGG
jgi:hypothetical protein